LVGQIYVRVGGNLGSIYFGSAMPGLRREPRQLAISAAQRRPKALPRASGAAAR
jgi:hypothetical protein